MKKGILAFVCLAIGVCLGFCLGRIGYVPELPIEVHSWEYFGTITDINIEDKENRVITVELDNGKTKEFRILPDTRDAGSVPYTDLTVGDTVYLIVEFYEQEPEVICAVFGAAYWTVPSPP